MRHSFSYQRFSTLVQGESGRDSQTRQSNSAKLWMEQYGTQLGYVLSNEVFLDAGKSGFKGKHIELDEFGKAKGELARFIECVQNGTIKNDSILLVDEYSRFSRLKPSKSLNLFMDVINSGIGLVFTSSYEKRVINTDLIDKEPNILQFIIGEMARTYSESAERGRKIKSSIQAKLLNIKNGIVYQNHLPSYYSFVQVGPAKNIGKYVQNDFSKVIKEIISLYLEGKSLYSIADSLNGRKITTAKGNEWVDNSISKLLHERTLIGEYKGNKNYVCEPLITETEFNKIQNLLKQNLCNRGRRGNFVNIFRGICFCSSCGKSMEVSNRFKDYKSEKMFKTPYRYLRCSNHGRENKCESRNLFPLADMEMDFFINFLFKTPGQFIKGDEDTETKQLNDTLATLQNQLNTITGTILKLSKVGKETGLEEMMIEAAKLSKERDSLKQQIDNVNSQLNKIQVSPQNKVDIQRLVIEYSSAEKFIKKAMADNSSEAKDKLNLVKIHITESLKNNWKREKIRSLIPSIIGKITVDGKNRKYFIYNRTGKIINQ